MKENETSEDEARELFEESFGISTDNLLEKARAASEHQERMRAEGKLPDGTDRDYPEQIVFGDLVWGSCQYDTAADTYHTLLRNAPESIEEYPYSSRREFLAIRNNAVAYLTEYYDDPIWADDPEWVSRRLEAMRNVSSIEEIFGVLRNSAWDLWKAAPMVCEWVFADLQMPEIADRTDGVGPHYNMIAQGENDRTGTYCALLTFNAGVDESAFMNFDT